MEIVLKPKLFTGKKETKVFLIIFIYTSFELIRFKTINGKVEKNI